MVNPLLGEAWRLPMVLQAGNLICATSLPRYGHRLIYESSKLFETLNMHVDLDIVVRQFKASARMLNMDMDATLRGNLGVEGLISNPRFKGALFISEGNITFPSISFPLLESQIVFDDNAKQSFDQQIDIVAVQDLEFEDYPAQIKEDTSIELAIRGNMEKLNLDLRAIRGDTRLSKLKFFFYC